MSKVLVDRELLDSAATWLEVHAPGGGCVEGSVAEDLRAILEQPAEAEALMKWKQTAEYWYGQYRLVKHGESPADYPTEGKLDDWHHSYHDA